MTKKEIMENKLRDMMAHRTVSISNAIKNIQQTGQLLDDYVVNVRDMQYGVDQTNDLFVQFNDNVGQQLTNSIHDNALNQVGARFGIPTSYLKNLAIGIDWQRELATTILNEHTMNIERDRLLLRTVNGQVRAALSDRYRRINSMKVFLTFLMAAQEAGSLLIDAHGGELKNYLEVIHPEVVEFNTEHNGIQYVVFGAQYRDSDFGVGASELRAYMMKVVCMNGLTGQQILKEVHLGSVIPENIEISQDTIVKDTEARVGFVRDAMKSIWKPQYKDAMIAKIQGASAQLIDVEDEVEKLPKLGLTKEEGDLLKKIMYNNDPENGLEGAPTLWKLTNGLTALARDSEPDRKRELETIAGQMVAF